MKDLRKICKRLVEAAMEEEAVKAPLFFWETESGELKMFEYSNVRGLGPIGIGSVLRRLLREAKAPQYASIFPLGAVSVLVPGVNERTYLVCIENASGEVHVEMYPWSGSMSAEDAIQMVSPYLLKAYDDEHWFKLVPFECPT